MPSSGASEDNYSVLRYINKLKKKKKGWYLPTISRFLDTFLRKGVSILERAYLAWVPLNQRIRGRLTDDPVGDLRPSHMP